MTEAASANEEAIGAWNGVLFDRFVQFRHLTTGALGVHGTRAMELFPPPAGGRVLDVGCGLGDTSRELAALVGPEGSVVGIDAAERFIELAAAETEEPNVSFRAGDVQVEALGEGAFDYVFSRMGIMFFANPVQALRNVREALVPGGRLVGVVWRRKLDNEWLHLAERVVERYLDEPDHDETVELTCGPGPFSMANADVTTEQMLAAGFADVSLTRTDIPILAGNDLDEAVALLTALGPAGEVIRLAGDEGEKLRPQIEAELREAYSGFVAEDGKIWGPASTWIVTGTA